MKKWLFGIVLAVISAVAFALPSPHQIEDALAAKDYDSAHSMVQQVLNEKPDSARAHLLNAFILEHVDHNLGAANQELSNAANLDKRGDVKNSSLFGRTVTEIDAQASKQTRTASVQQQPVQYAPNPVAAAPTPYVEPVHKSSGHGFLIFLLIVVVVGLIAYFLIRGATRRDRVVVESVYTPPYRDNTNVRLSSSSAVSAPRVTYVDPAPVVVHHPAPVIVNSGGYGYNNNGLVEGMMIGQMMENNRELSREIRDEDRYSSRRRESDSSSSWDNTPAYVAPAPEPVKSTPVSYSNERSSYSSGSDDSWSSRSSSSDSYSSSSSSSSWDSGSSSSSYDSGSSSYDSGFVGR